MMKQACYLTACLLLTLTAIASADETTKEAARPLLNWQALPPLPDEVGFAGMYAGTSHGALIVAGGANFPDKPFWDGGKKAWHDTIWVLEDPAGPWRRAERTLPRPMGYGAAVTYQDAVICIGGNNAEGNYADVFALRWEHGQVSLTELPPLPEPSAYMCAAVLGDKVYVAGGLEQPGAKASLHRFRTLDLSQPRAKMAWEVLEPWPGPARHQAIAAVQDGSFFVVSGMRLEPDASGKTTLAVPYLSDAYRYTPGTDGAAGRWARIADLPRPTAAAPSPAMTLGQSHFAIFGGLDGSNLHTDPQQFPPFPRQILTYHTLTDTWAQRGLLPEGASRVTAPTTWWRQSFVIPNGEIGPGRRSPKVYRVTQTQGATAFGSLDWTVLGIYLGGMLLVGVYFSKRGQTTEDFFIGGRRIPWWAAGLSIFGTQLSAITFMATPAVAYATDWVQLIGSFTILALAPLVIYFYLPFFRRLNVSTAYEYLEVRFSLPVRLFGSLTFMLTQLGRIGIVVYLPSIALAAVTGMDVYLCIVVIGLLCTIYTVMGGIEAVIWTDVVQVIVLLGGAALCLALIVADVGGFGELLSRGAADEKFRMFDWRWDATALVVWVLVVGNLFINLMPYTADQTVVQRYLTTPDEKQAARSIWTNGLLSLPAGVLFFLVGTGLYVFYQANPGELDPGRNDAILPWFIVQQLPAGVSGLVVAGIFAAAMSSLDSSMNSVASAYVNDFHRRFRPDTSDRAGLRLARLVTVMVGVFGTAAAILLVSIDVGLIFNYFITVMSLFGGGLTGIFFLGVFTRRTTGAPALVGALLGALVPLVVWLTTDLNFYLYAVIGVLTCIISGYGLSLLLPAPAPRDLAGLTLFTLQREAGVPRVAEAVAAD